MSVAHQTEPDWNTRLFCLVFAWHAARQIARQVTQNYDCFYVICGNNSQTDISCALKDNLDAEAICTHINSINIPSHQKCRNLKSILIQRYKCFWKFEMIMISTWPVCNNNNHSLPISNAKVKFNIVKVETIY